MSVTKRSLNCQPYMQYSYLTYWLLIVNELGGFKVDLVESWSISALASDSSYKVVNLSNLKSLKNLEQDKIQVSNLVQSWQSIPTFVVDKFEYYESP